MVLHSAGSCGASLELFGEVHELIRNVVRRRDGYRGDVAGLVVDDQDRLLSGGVPHVPDSDVNSRAFTERTPLT